MLTGRCPRLRHAAQEGRPVGLPVARRERARLGRVQPRQRGAVLRRRPGQGVRADRSPQPARGRRRRRRCAHRRHVLGGAEQHRRGQPAGGDRRQRQRPQLRADDRRASPTTWPRCGCSRATRRCSTRVARAVRGVPVIGEFCYQCMHSIKAGIKDALSPQVMFTDLGLKYVGPIDGHDEHAVESALRHARGFNAPGDRARRHPQGHGLRAGRERRGRADALLRRHRPADRPGHLGRRPRLDVGVLRRADRATPPSAATSWRSPPRCPARPG